MTKMLGYSPPLRANRVVPPPPEGERSSLLFHIDRVEDWTPRGPRSPESYQSSLPSSGSDDDDRRPMLEIATLDWRFNVEDNREHHPPPAPAPAPAPAPRHQQRVRQAPRVASTGCRARTPRLPARPAPNVTTAASRGRVTGGATSTLNQDAGATPCPAAPLLPPAAAPVAVAPPPPPAPPAQTDTPLPPAEEPEDQVARFFANRSDTITPPRWTDSMVFEVNATIEAALAQPLPFSPKPPKKLAKQMTADHRAPSTLSRARPPLRSCPSPTLKMTKTATPTTVEPVHLPLVTAKMDGLEIGQCSSQEDQGKQAVARALFTDVQQPIIASPIAPPPDAGKPKKQMLPPEGVLAKQEQRMTSRWQAELP
nr:formin-like protein 5 [Aegilops tauschii subsp. strangulata]